MEGIGEKDRDEGTCEPNSHKRLGFRYRFVQKVRATERKEPATQDCCAEKQAEVADVKEEASKGVEHHSMIFCAKSISIVGKQELE